MIQLIQQLNNCVLIGEHTGENLTKAEYLIFLGDGAGKGKTTCSYKFILETENFTIKKDINKEQWESFNEIIRGSIITKK